MTTPDHRSTGKLYAAAAAVALAGLGASQPAQASLIIESARWR